MPTVAAVRRNADSRVSAKLAYEETYSLADWRVRAVANAIERDGDRRLLAGIFSRADTQTLGHAIDAGIRESSTPAPAAIVWPRRRPAHQPRRRRPARTAIRAAAHLEPQPMGNVRRVPVQVFPADVLKLEPLGDLVLETDYARRGSRLHDVLAAFHRQWPHAAQASSRRTPTTKRTAVPRPSAAR